MKKWLRRKKLRRAWAFLRWFFTPDPGGAARKASTREPDRPSRIEFIAVPGPQPRPPDVGSDASGGDCGGEGD